MDAIAALTGALFQLAVLAALLLFVGILFRGRAGRAGEKRVERLLIRLHAEALHDIILPDGRGGLTQIDHLVLTDRALLVLETKEYSGMVLGRERESHWTQRLGGKSYRFQNPLRQNYLHIEAVRSAVPGIPVAGHVVFAGTARFPKGIPRGVSTLGAMRELLVDTYGVHSPSRELGEAWERVKARAVDTPEARKAHLSQAKARKAARASAARRPREDNVTAAVGLSDAARVVRPTPSAEAVTRPIALPAGPPVLEGAVQPLAEIVDRQLQPMSDLALPSGTCENGLDRERAAPVGPDSPRPSLFAGHSRQGATALYLEARQVARPATPQLDRGAHRGGISGEPIRQAQADRQG